MCSKSPGINSEEISGRLLGYTDDCFMILCPSCSYPMFSASEQNQSVVTLMVEGVDHGQLFQLMGGTIRGSCPGCGTSFIYQTGQLTAELFPPSVLYSD